MEKLSKTARVLDRIIKVLRGICFGFAIAFAILLVIGIVLPDNLYSHFVVYDMYVDFGSVQLQLSKVLEPQGPVRLYVCAILASGMAALVLGGFGLHLLRKILAPMKDGRPFDSVVSENLRKLAWLNVGGGVIANVIKILVTMFEINMYDFSELFASNLVTGCTIKYQYDITFLLFAALLFLLSYIFKYGEELQRQSDETL